MRTMSKKAVVVWFDTQGMPQAANQFDNLFSGIENIDIKSIKEFLHVIYGTGDDEYIFSKMQGDINLNIIE